MAGSSFKLGKTKQSKNDITSAGGTTTLTNSSDHYQYVTGSSSQTIKLPDATTMSVGVGFDIVNANSTGNVTVVDNGSNTLATLTPGSSTEFVCASTASANGTWMQANGAGGSGISVNTISSNTSLANNTINLINTSTSAITLTLPAPASGATIYVEDESGNALTNAITINQHASETIDGFSSYTIVFNYGAVRLTSDGTNWFVVGDINNTSFIIASGGTVTTSGNQRIHTFTSSGNLLIQNYPSGATVSYLVVSGGGGGGGGSVSAGGGGGGGGVIYSTGVSMTTGSFSAVVGAGALGSNFTGSGGVQGSSSSFNGSSPVGGGSGQGNGNGTSGGSGAGGGGSNASGGAGTGGQGNAGGSVSGTNSNFAGAGGGGAGAVGGNGNSSTGVGGNGGAGISNSISGSAVFYGGGGGGGANVTIGTGGSGGGGNGGFNGGNGTDGTANTGGGGGGGELHSTGGSGIVIVSYQYK